MSDETHLVKLSSEVEALEVREVNVLSLPPVALLTHTRHYSSRCLSDHLVDYASTRHYLTLLPLPPLLLVLLTLRLRELFVCQSRREIPWVSSTE